MAGTLVLAVSCGSWLLARSSAELKVKGFGSPLHGPLHGLLGLPHSMVAKFQEQVS